MGIGVGVDVGRGVGVGVGVGVGRGVGVDAREGVGVGSTSAITALVPVVTSVGVTSLSVQATRNRPITATTIARTNMPLPVSPFLPFWMLLACTIPESFRKGNRTVG